METFKLISNSLKIFSKRERRRYQKVVVIQSMLGLLDLFGILLLGLIGSQAVRGVQSKGLSDTVHFLWITISLPKLDFQQQILVLGVVSALLLSGKTLLSVFFSRKILMFLSIEGARISQKVVYKFLNQTIDKIQLRNSQEVVLSLSQGVNTLAVGVLGLAVTVVSDLFLLLIMVLALILINPPIAIASILIFGTVGFGFYSAFHSEARRIGIDSNRLIVDSNQKILEVLGSYRELFVRNQLTNFAKQISDLKFKYSRQIAQQAWIPNLTKYVAELTLVLGGLLVAGVVFALQDAAHAVSSLAIFMAASSRIAPAIMRIQQNLIQINVNYGHSQFTLNLIIDLSSVELLDEPEKSHNVAYERFIPKIKVDNLRFRRQNSGTDVISIESLEIEPGMLVALVGPTGAGKSTLVDLILGILEPTQGSVSISNELPFEAIKKWPGAIAYVPQNVSIHKGSILENLTFGILDRDLNPSMIQDAINSAKLIDLIDSLPAGLETQLGENGYSISGGQRQQVGIARALVTNPKLLILDEATSALDGVSEALFSNAMFQFRGKKTIIMIAHRLSTVRMADQVIYLDKGEVKATGTFDEVRKAVPDFDSQASLMGL